MSSFFQKHQTFFGLTVGAVILAGSLLLGIFLLKGSPAAYGYSAGNSSLSTVGGVAALVHGRPALILIHPNGQVSAQFLSSGVEFPGTNPVSVSCQGGNGAFSCFAVGPDHELYQDLYNHGHPIWQRLNPVPVP